MKTISASKLSEPGKGSVFAVVLPVMTAEGEAA